MYSIEADSLSKEYDSGSKAIDNVAITVENGEIFGFLGPNGAGKSTTIMILTTLLSPTSGYAIVGGHDVQKQPDKVRENIGLVQQDPTVDEYLTGRENLELQAKLYHLPRHIIRNRVDEVLNLVELEERQDDPVVVYSGGMRRRLDIAGGLLHRPKILFLDEPTLGLDIQTRYKIWDYIRKIHNEVKTSIFLTTHYMEEADKLCDKISIIDYGKIKVTDTPASLKKSMGKEVVIFSYENSDNHNRHDGFLDSVKNISQVHDLVEENDMLMVYCSHGESVIPTIFELSSKHGIKISSISLNQPSLDDVFLHYTGRGLRDEGSGSYDFKREAAKFKRIRS